MTVLIVEDEPRVAELVARGLTAAGLATRVVADGLEGLAQALRPEVELVVLDLGLPSLGGDQLLSRLAEHRPELPVLVLSARDAIADQVRTLGAGAVDYLTKPFEVAELVARVQVQLRVPPAPVRTHHRVELDTERRVARYGLREVALSDREFRVLDVLMTDAGTTVGMDALVARAWDGDAPASNVVAAAVRRLRTKLPDGAIETLPGVGYRLVG